MNIGFVETQNQFGDACTIKDIVSLQNQSFAKILIESTKCIAKKWETFSQRRNKSSGERIRQIASAYYLNQLP